MSKLPECADLINQQFEDLRNIKNGLSREDIASAWIDKAMQLEKELHKIKGNYLATALHRDKLKSLLSKALDRFTDNDMMPPNHDLAEWIKQSAHAVSENWASDTNCQSGAGHRMKP